MQNTLDECILKETATWQIRDILYDRTTDYINAVQSRLEKALAAMNIGVTVESLALPVKRPPVQTIEAFDEAMSAGTQAATEIEAARGCLGLCVCYSAQTLPSQPASLHRFSK